ncbi:MAG: DUF3016 domain-containing protein [Iodobacter sp.]
MKKLLTGFILPGLICTAAWAGEAKVSWQNPEKYTDIRSSHELQERFEKRIFEHFEQLFADLAKPLPGNSTLEITVTDLDLAGEIPPLFAGRSNEVRIIKELYSPKISFSYVFTDQDQIITGTENLRDLNFMAGLSRPVKTSEFQYEDKMIKRWFAHKAFEKNTPAR